MRKGEKHTKESIEKMRKNARWLGKRFKHSEETLSKLRGRKLSEEHKRKISEIQSNRSIEWRTKLGDHYRGMKSIFWKGGITKRNEAERKTLQYRMWRTEVFKRDDYTCQFCGKRGVKLHADHIQPFAYYPELRFTLDNGRTLCVPCHKNTSTYGVNIITNIRQ